MICWKNGEKRWFVIFVERSLQRRFWRDWRGSIGLGVRFQSVLFSSKTATSRMAEKTHFGRVFFARDFGHKSISETRRSEMIPFHEPKRTRTKLIFSGHLYRTVFDESGTDQKLTLGPINLFYSHQKRRRVGRLKKYVLVAYLFCARFWSQIDFRNSPFENDVFLRPQTDPNKSVF